MAFNGYAITIDNARKYAFLGAAKKDAERWGDWEVISLRQAEEDHAVADKHVTKLLKSGNRYDPT
jgi:hypothetical protein